MLISQELNYQFSSDYAVVVIRVATKDGWTEADADTMAYTLLAEAVREPKDFAIDEVFELDTW